jgi:hypothetical protein
MLSGMRLVLVLVLGTCALVWAKADARDASSPPRAGKVVRIERRSKRFGGEPRVCAITGGEGGYCYGKQPQIGDTITFLDATHTLGAATVDKVDPFGQCKGPSNVMWLVQFRGASSGLGGVGGLGGPSGADTVTGLLDVTVDPHGAKTMTVDEVPANRPLQNAAGFDIDGDGRVDLEFLPFTCDDRGDYVAPGVAGNTNIPSTCLEMWYANGHTFERLHAERISPNCL